METRDMLAQAGCILEGEYFFALKKRGKVSKKYINIDPVFTNPGSVRSLGYALKRPFDRQFNCVVGPAIGGIPLVYAVAFAKINGLDMTQQAHQVSTAFAEKDDDGFIFDRMGFAQAVRDKRVLIVEDISTTGSSTKAVCDLVTQAGGELIGVSLVWNRGEIAADMLGVPRLHSLVNESVETFDIEANPPGWGELPLVADIGHPDYYPDYQGPRITLLTS